MKLEFLFGLNVLILLAESQFFPFNFTFFSRINFYAKPKKISNFLHKIYQAANYQNSINNQHLSKINLER